MTQGPHSSTQPQLSPPTQEDRFLWLRLLRSRRVGPTTFHRLLRDYGSAAQALDALPDIAKQAGVDNYHPCSVQTANAELDAACQFGAVGLYYGDPDYPAALYDVPDAPPLLWAKGDLSLLRQPKIALVGARNASSLGARMARGLAQALGAEGQIIVSGLARGIDTAAHKAALPTGTIAVFAGGVDRIYPAENSHLAAEIAESGLILSEQPLGLSPKPRHFPARNRIVSGLSQAVVVVEAAAKSGSLITARNALDQGRDVFAVPGHPIDSRSAGCNLLIRDGAHLVRSGADVLEALAPIAPMASCAAGSRQQELALPVPDHDHPASEPPKADRYAEIQTTPPSAHHTPSSRTGLSVSGADRTDAHTGPGLREVASLHQDIINRVTISPVAEDHLIRDLALSTQQATSALTDLELDGRIVRTSAGLLTASQ